MSASSAGAAEYWLAILGVTAYRIASSAVLRNAWVSRIRVLAGVERALRAHQKPLQKTMDIGGGFQVFGTMPLGIRKCVNPQVLRPHLHDLLEMRLFPIATR